jgi:hypothetical protein
MIGAESVCHRGNLRGEKTAGSVRHRTLPSRALPRSVKRGEHGVWVRSSYRNDGRKSSDVSAPGKAYTTENSNSAGWQKIPWKISRESTNEHLGFRQTKISRTAKELLHEFAGHLLR